MRFKTNFLRRYLEIAPSALAIERAIECGHLAQRDWPTPILDIGCGDGVFAQILFEDPVDVGVDLDQEEIDRAKKYNGYREFVTCSADEIPKIDESFNTIFANSVLEHIPDLSPVLAEVHRLMTQEARFYITIPTDRLERATLIARMLTILRLKGLAERYGKFHCKFWLHHHAYSEEKWRDLFARAGFEVEEEFSYIPPNQSTLMDILTPLALPGFISKKLFDRWILLPKIRSMLVGPLHLLINSAINSMNTGNEKGVLVFYTLKKSK